MCDEQTEAQNAAWLSRRQFGAAGAGLVVMATIPGCSEAQSAPGNLAVKGRAVTVTTPDGKADAWFYAPETGKHPAVIMWPDIAGLREAYKTMASRLASAGYAVLVVNHYYRGAVAPVLDSLVAWRTPEGQAKLKPLIAAITPAATTSDAKAFVGWLDAQPEVDTAKKIGTCGYCMGGPYTVRTAAAVPDRVGAAASFHGGGLVGSEADSPVNLLAKTKASFLFAIAQND
ncbi:MAG: dienelactone hydrolase family protein, partial [Novosphingobium sp.]|nr:dienelactone hydrolase family protein [Novosphingobium sp.]